MEEFFMDSLEEVRSEIRINNAQAQKFYKKSNKDVGYI
jgi:ribosomal protein S18 acetylase RimI-like enzyme